MCWTKDIHVGKRPSRDCASQKLGNTGSSQALIFRESGKGGRVQLGQLHPGRLLKEGLIAFVDDSALTRGAAIAFYAVTAIAPVLFIATAVAGVFLGPAAASGAVRYQLRQMMSPESADLVQGAIVHVRGVHHSLQGSLIGLVALIVTASGVFTEMEDALNVIWKAPRQGAVLPRLLRGRAVSLILVIGLGLLLLASMSVSAAITVLGHTIQTPFGQFGLILLNLGVSFVLMSVMFAAIYKVLPNKELEWRDVALGAIVTELLFLVGQFLLGYYFGSSGIARPYGAAGGLIVLLVWVYYSAQVFLLGAEFTKVYAVQHGSQRGVCDA